MELERDGLLDELLETPGVSGYESRCQRVWIDHVTGRVDAVETDPYDNAVARVDGDGSTTVAVTSHIDAVGYVVRRIDDRGYLHVGGVGAVDGVCARGQRVTVHAADDDVTGVVVHTPTEMRDWSATQLTDPTELRIDIGAHDRADARTRVAVGDPVTIAAEPATLANGRIAARCHDNRIGAYVVAEVVRHAAVTTTETTVLGVSTVQEEIGRRGAEMVTAEYDVDAVIVVDAAIATDAPAAPTAVGNEITLGGGPVVARGGGNHQRLVTAARSAADSIDRSIQLQATPVGTGTDADVFAAACGPVPTLHLGFPTRNLHTPVEVVDRSDVETTVELLAELLSTIGADGL
ncbi:M20/M25/M40 family metallo-hydrolase [Natrinema ejinorense]|uniref:Endoglucanase n=1 Tax=Natrinema ejinorense TaxID=373386 RepID=A0A2A5QYQ3_9EURY|nr:M20/M25/M40 family metallo-hydrolase [Natrinema ejinorense]PCR91903.1 endoglucanase [Natrinema ejinorense]